MINMTELMEILKLLIAAALGTLGFSIIFYNHPRRLLPSTLGGLLTGGVYVIAIRLIGNEFLANLIAAFVGTTYSEICARRTFAPAVIYLVPCIIPLAPGGALYYTMSHIVSGNYASALQYGKTTFEVAFGIAGGLISASLIWSLARKSQRNSKA